MKTTKTVLIISLAVAFIAGMLTVPKICICGAIKGITLCGETIIPSLFPFTVCILMIMRSQTGKIPKEKTVFFLSLIGGYPIGAKLIDELYNNGEISKNGAHLMQCCCVNAGPAFIVTAVGAQMLKSEKIGWYLLFSHIFPSLMIYFVLRKRIKKSLYIKNTDSQAGLKISTLFTESIGDASSSIILICAYVILFSVVTELISSIKKTSRIAMFLEVTTAISNEKNIYIIAFLLGFSGISIWMQVFAVSKNCGINTKLFILFRILHGILSALILKFLILIFNPSFPTISIANSERIFVMNPAETAVSLCILAAVFILSFENQKNVEIF